MTQSVSNFFDTSHEDQLTGRGGVRRDSRGRALLVPKGLAGTDVRAPYSSASGLADHISDDSFLHTWQMRYLARGLGQREDLAALAALETYHTGLDPLDIAEKRSSGRALDRIIERALDHVKIHEKADYGTVVHGFTEPGLDLSVCPERMRHDVESFWEVVRREAIVLSMTEAFTANDATMTAGTFDHLLRMPHPLLQGYVVADKKTGRVDPHHWAIQLATYAYGELYDTETDTRLPWPGEVNRKYALMSHIPALRGVTDLYVLDIEIGWEMAQIAAKVRDYHDRKDLLVDFKPADFMTKLNLCEDAEMLRALWKSTDNTAEQALVSEKASTL